MAGLIIKDFMNLKKNLRIFGVFILLYGFMALTMNDTSFFSNMFTILFAILTLSLYSYDEMAKWDNYVLTMPVTKEQVVQCKYIMLLLLTLLGVTISTIFSFAINFIHHTNIELSSLEFSLGSAAVIILLYCIIIPFITKLGVEKARLIFFVIYIVPFIMVGIVRELFQTDQETLPTQVADLLNFFIHYIAIILPTMVILGLAISYSASVKIYQKKEF